MRAIDADALMKDVRENSESYFADDFAEFWVNRQPTIHAEPHWIPVEQALPEYGVDCIVSVKQKYTWQTDWEYFVDLGWRGDYIDGVWDTANDWDEGQVTHISAWMPLPEPFKGVTE